MGFVNPLSRFESVKEHHPIKGIKLIKELRIYAILVIVVILNSIISDLYYTAKLSKVEAQLAYIKINVDAVNLKSIRLEQYVNNQASKN